MSPVSSARAAFLASALLAVNLAIIGPGAVHAANLGEYSASFWSVLGHLAVAAAFVAAALLAALLCVPRGRRGRPVVFVFSLAVLAWLQGNWLLPDAGVLDGGGLDMAAIAADRARDAALWLGGIVAAQAGYRLLAPWVARLAGVLLVLQLAALPLAGMMRADDAPQSLPLVPDPGIFELSRGPNLLLVILDTVTSDTFVRFARSQPARSDADFPGFVVYTDTVGAFPSTQYSLPVMLGAPPFDNTVPVDDYMRSALQRDSLTLPFMAAGFEVDWVSPWPLFCRQGRASRCYAVPRPYVEPVEYHARMAAELLDLSLFRHAPAPLKPWIYADGDWRLQLAFFADGEPPLFVSSAARFYDDFNAALQVGRDAPTLKIVHTGGGHGPFVLDAECNGVPKRPYAEAHYEAQLRCGLAQTAELFRRLRELGVYDAATIVLAGDHGSSFGSRGLGSHGLTRHRLSRSRPLLAVKWPGAGPGLRTSRAPASIADIAPTLAAAAGLRLALGGLDLADLEPGVPRRRDYGLYTLRRGTPGGHLERVERYSVGPESRDPGAWRFEGAVFSPAAQLPGLGLDAAPGSNRAFSLLGWGAPGAGAGARPARGPVAGVFVRLPAGEPVRLRARLRVPEAFLPQVIDVAVDGASVGEWRFTDPGFADRELAIPGARIAEPVTALVFRPRRHQPPGGGAAAAFELVSLELEPGG